MASFTMLIGIQGSGKSTFSKKMENCRVLSSDAIRGAVLGDRQDQSSNALIFDIMNRQAKYLLEKGHDVIYDATNASAKRRMALLKTLPEGTVKRAVYFATPLDTAIARDSRRALTERVGKEVIIRTYKSFDVPMIFEGFDEIIYREKGEFQYSDSIDLHLMLSNGLDSYSSYCDDFLTGSSNKCIDFAQDNPHHTFSVSKHMYHTALKVAEYGNLNLTMAAALHDCGKPYCREYKKDGYACFYGHDKVSAQIAVEQMISNGLSSKRIAYISTLINLHMRMHQEGGKDRLLNLVREDMYKELELLYQADSTAK